MNPVISGLVNDPEVTDILINGDGSVWVDRGLRLEPIADCLPDSPEREWLGHATEDTLLYGLPRPALEALWTQHPALRQQVSGIGILFPACLFRGCPIPRTGAESPAAAKPVFRDLP